MQKNKPAANKRYYAIELLPTLVIWLWFISSTSKQYSATAAGWML